MIKKIFTSLIILFTSMNLSLGNSSDIYIYATIDEKIITNYDIKKETEYLKILNNNLNNLDNQKIFNLAKESLINEIIKRNEIDKFTEFDKKNSFVDDHLNNLILKLNYNNKEHFIKTLEQRNSYTLQEIEKKLKIELFWNELIYKKYKNQVRIDKVKLKKKIDSFTNKIQKQYFLSEIVFKKKKDDNLELLFNQIKLSIGEIGFDNTANIYSISESAKLGGKLGWINENSLSKKILKELSLINKGEYTKIIKINNNYLLLKIDQIKENKIEENKNKEFQKLLKFETNKQLNQFSRIYFNKSKINYSINEK